MAMKKSSALNGKVFIFVNAKTGMTLTAWKNPTVRWPLKCPKKKVLSTSSGKWKLTAKKPSGW